MRLSRRTLGALARVLEKAYKHSDLDVLEYELGVEQAVSGYNKLARSVSLVQALEVRCMNQNDDSSLMELLQKTLASLTTWQFSNVSAVSGLLKSLNVDGFDYVDGTLRPSTPGSVALSPQISNLEMELDTLGFDVAKTHYIQACENLVDGNFESANGQIRSYLENLFIVLCMMKAEKEFDDPGAALQHLRDKGIIEPAEWNTFRGFWDSCQTNGPHHGLSNSEESLYRVHIATAIGRYVLQKCK